MKILHTSDWHLGHEHYNYKRQDEFEDFFIQLTRIVAEQQPDALLVSGDIYHVTIPAVATQTMYTEAMLRLHEACPTMHIVVTAGNHDSASRLAIDRSLWSYFHVHVVGGLARKDNDADYDRHIIHIGGKGIVAAVPHVFKQNFPPADTPGGDRQKAFYTKLMSRVEEVNTEGLPVVLMAHLAVKDPAEDTADIVGGMEYQDVAVLGGGSDYAALGHLHRPSQVPAKSTAVRYCGAPLPITFNEEYEHSVTIATLEHGQPPRLNVVPLKPLRHVRTIPKQPVPFNEALDVLRQLPGDVPDYIRLNVCSEGGLPIDANEQALEAAEGKACRFCTFNLVDTTHTARRTEQMDVTPDQLREMTPIDVAQKYLESKNMDPAQMMEMMRETMNIMEEEEAR